MITICTCMWNDCSFVSALISNVQIIFSLHYTLWTVLRMHIRSSDTMNIPLPTKSLIFVISTLLNRVADSNMNMLHSLNSDHQCVNFRMTYGDQYKLQIPRSYKKHTIWRYWLWNGEWLNSFVQYRGKNTIPNKHTLIEPLFSSDKSATTPKNRPGDDFWSYSYY